MESIRQQDFPDFESIIVDDGSTDASAERVAHVLESDPRFTLITQANAGVSAARNAGAAAARGRFLAFLDADDQWLPGYLKKIADAAQCHPNASVLVSDYWRMPSADRRLPSRFRRQSTWAQERELTLEQFLRFSGLGCNPMWTSAVVLSRTLFHEVGGFPVGVQRGEDIDTWLRVMIHARSAIWLPQQNALYRQDAENSITKTTETPVLGFPTFNTVQTMRGQFPVKEVRLAARYHNAAVAIGLRRRFRAGTLRRADLAELFWWASPCTSVRYHVAAAVPASLVRGVVSARSRVRYLLRGKPPVHPSVRSAPLTVAMYIANMSGGGAQRVVAELANAMAGSHRVIVFTKRDAPCAFDLDSGVEFRSLAVAPKGLFARWGLFQNLAQMRSLGRALRQHGVDILVAHTNRNNVLAIPVARAQRVPVVAVEHSIARSLHSPLWRALRAIIYPLASRVVVLSASELHAYRKAKTTVVPNPIPRNVERRMTTPSNRPGAPPLRILFVGRLEPEKRPELILHACAALTQNQTLTMVGDGSMMNACADLARRLNMQDSLELAGWQADPVPFYQRSHVILLASRFEGFPMALIEAMAFGCVPVVVRCPGGVSDIIEHNVNGLLVEEHSSDAETARVLSQTIQTVITNSERLAALSLQAQQTIQKYAMKNVLELWTDLFDCIRPAGVP